MHKIVNKLSFKNNQENIAQVNEMKIKFVRKKIDFCFCLEKATSANP